MNTFKQHQKIRINKKGQWSTLQKFVVAAALIIILLFIAKTQLFGSSNQLTNIRFSATNDFDGDGTKDNMDEAPCTFGDMKILQQGEKDIFYPVQRPVASIGGSVPCPPKGTSTSTQTCTGQTYEGKTLRCVLDRETEELYCALTQKDCDAMLKAEYELLKAQ